MAEIDAALVKELREETGVGMMDCKRALQECGGDTDAATELLRKQGLAERDRRAGREAKEGLIEAYVHGEGKIGVLVEVNCETDFVARNTDFRTFAHDIAMQIAAASPAVALYVSRDEVPQQLVESESAIFKAQAMEEGKPENVAEKIIAGRLEKFFAAVCLLEQPFIKDPDKTIDQCLSELVGKIGENITIRRFVRFERGGSA